MGDEEFVFFLLENTAKKAADIELTAPVCNSLQMSECTSSAAKKVKPGK